jgi:hypothetical protein
MQSLSRKRIFLLLIESSDENAIFFEILTSNNSKCGIEYERQERES